MKVLVVYGSKRGTTGEIAESVARELQSQGLTVDVVPVAEADGVPRYDAVIVGGALYIERWYRTARRFVRSHREALAAVPVWFFSSGPLDNSASEGDVPPVKTVSKLMQTVDARGHKTFGGKLESNDHSPIARALARDGMVGDFRDEQQIRAWADEIAEALLGVRPG